MVGAVDRLRRSVRRHKLYGLDDGGVGRLCFRPRIGVSRDVEWRHAGTGLRAPADTMAYRQLQLADRFCCVRAGVGGSRPDSLLPVFV